MTSSSGTPLRGGLLPVVSFSGPALALLHHRHRCRRAHLRAARSRQLLHQRQPESRRAAHHRHRRVHVDRGVALQPAGRRRLRASSTRASATDRGYACIDARRSAGRTPRTDAPVAGTSLWQDAGKRLRRNRLAVFGIVVVCIVVAASLVGPLDDRACHRLHLRLHPDRSARWSLACRRSPRPTARSRGLHPMGTDDAGRDMLARVLLGGRISLMVGLISTARLAHHRHRRSAPLPATSAARSTKSMMRDGRRALLHPVHDGRHRAAGVLRRPSPLGQLVLLFIALGAVSWLTMARIVRGQVMSLKNQEFILAARATGVPACADHRRGTSCPTRSARSSSTPRSPFRR